MNTAFVTDVKQRLNKLKLQESYAGLVLGAIIVIVLGLLVANYFSRSGGQIGTAETTSQPQAETQIPVRKYKVASGDSLSSIATRQYGEEKYWVAISAANKISDPNIISVDSELTIPAKVDAEKLVADMSVTSYQVNEGDTLFVIAEKVYGNGAQWQLIADANNVGRLPNGNPLIYAGSTLVIPR